MILKTHFKPHIRALSKRQMEIIEKILKRRKSGENVRISNTQKADNDND